MAKTISLILMDNTADGRIKCKLQSRTGIIFRIPRKDLSKCKDIKELSHDSVYFLLGEDKIYIGQAGNRNCGKGIFNRLNEHDKSKTFWAEAIVFTTTDNSFGPTEISWLENKFYNLAKDAARCALENGNIPSPGNTTEEKQSELEEHVDFAKLILSAIGYKMFEQKKISPPPIINPGGEIFYLSRHIKKIDRTINAQMIRTATGYKVLAGSDVCPEEVERISDTAKEFRHSEKVANDILLEDLEFKSSSTAAEFVTGNNANGRTSWKTKDGVELKNFL